MDSRGSSSNSRTYVLIQVQADVSLHAGLTKGSVMVAAADVGAAEIPVSFQQRFVLSADEGGVVADRQADAP